MQNSWRVGKPAELSIAGNNRGLSSALGTAPRHAAPIAADAAGPLNRSERLRHFVTVQMVKSGNADEFE
jgi:hypothetical protein